MGANPNTLAKARHALSDERTTNADLRVKQWTLK
jgi:hypothetical protein